MRMSLMSFHPSRPAPHEEASCLRRLSLVKLYTVQKPVTEAQKVKSKGLLTATLPRLDRSILKTQSGSAAATEAAVVLSGGKLSARAGVCNPSRKNSSRQQARYQRRS